MRKSKPIPSSREWAMEIVSFARSKDTTRYNLAGYNLEPNRVVATDGQRLAWQEFGPIVPDSYHGLIDEYGNPAEGEFPDYKAVLPARLTSSFTSPTTAIGCRR
jgi:DNA polymerase III sliding clamp (beta) subunit (PCNA family)